MPENVNSCNISKLVEQEREKELCWQSKEQRSQHGTLLVQVAIKRNSEQLPIHPHRNHSVTRRGTILTIYCLFNATWIIGLKAESGEATQLIARQW